MLLVMRQSRIFEIAVGLSLVVRLAPLENMEALPI